LKRERLANGRYEACQPHHSWNTNHILSNLFLFHLQRHSDHHTNPMVPYQSLRNFDELPHLPSGYPGSFLLAVVPPLWRRVMDPKVAKWADGDWQKCNVAPGMENHYALAFQKM
ncbi:MAG: alkane 1-monooxygenase, partial [Pseudomonadota bacterium]